MEMINQLGKFLPTHAEIIRPMTALLGPKCSWIWGPYQTNAFSKVKEKNPMVLTLQPYRRAKTLSKHIILWGRRSTLTEG